MYCCAFFIQEAVKNAPELISEPLKLKYFLGEHAPHTPLAGALCALVPPLSPPPFQLVFLRHCMVACWCNSSTVFTDTISALALYHSGEIRHLYILSSSCYEPPHKLYSISQSGECLIVISCLSVKLSSSVSCLSVKLSSSVSCLSVKLSSSVSCLSVKLSSSVSRHCCIRRDMKGPGLCTKVSYPSGLEW